MTIASKPKTQYAPNPAILGGQPRYVQLAQTLLNEIESGRYPVGAQLPTEFELCEQFGVSRSTAREAVKRLVSLGLVVRQPRVGTTVCARSAVAGYRQSIAEVSDLYQYATETTLMIESSEMLEINASEAQLVEGEEGETWLHLRGRRHAPASKEPICATELWIHPAFRSIKGLQGALTGAVHAMIEKQFGEVITSVEQEIRATLLTDDQAKSLQAEPLSAGLWVCRKYRNKLNQLVELAISVHPADRFSYSTVLRREWGVGAAKPVIK
jgi:GntR family transcriptional regulator